MDGNSLTTLLLLLGLGTAAYFLLARSSESAQDTREPPTVSGSIPYIGHVIGIMRSKFNYYVQLRCVNYQNLNLCTLEVSLAYLKHSHQNSLPIFTMSMPGQKMYVVTTPDLIQAIQKQPKALAFPPIEAKFASAVCGVSKEAHNTLLKNVNGDEGDWGLSMESYAAMRSALAPGAGLDKMNRTMIENIATSLDQIVPSRESRMRLQLSKWLRSAITLATTNAVYGPQNPFKNQAVQDGFWYVPYSA